MFVNVLKILLKTLLYPLNNVFESLIQLNTYLLENTKIIDVVFWVVICCFRGKVIEQHCAEFRKYLQLLDFFRSDYWSIGNRTYVLIFPFYRNGGYWLWGEVFVSHTDSWTGVGETATNKERTIKKKTLRASFGVLIKGSSSIFMRILSTI